jgi:hypothetical protein
VELYQHYDTGDDFNALVGYAGVRCYGQTFTPEITHKLTRFSILACRSGLNELIALHITPTSGGLPSGADLHYQEFNGNIIPLCGSPQWIDFDISGDGVEVEAGTTYCVWFKYIGGTTAKYFRWRADNSSPTYARGTAVYSADGGSSWSAYAGRDFMFREYGEPAFPPLNPYANWSLRDITYECTSTGFKVHAVTDVECHLHARWTYTIPQVHLDPYTVRGVKLSTSPRYCFDNYFDKEQDEAGDTLEHTFTFYYITQCATVFFYLWGTMGSFASPSESATFDYTRVCPVTVQCPAILGSNGFYAEGEDYDLMRLWAFAPLDATPGQITVGQSQDPSPDLYLWRAMLFFDTSAVPKWAAITDAAIVLYRRVGGSLSAIASDDQYLCVVSASPKLNPPLYAVDYGALFGNSRILGQVTPDFWREGADPWRPITLNAYGKSRIVPEGISTYGLRGKRDLLGIGDFPSTIYRDRYDMDFPSSGGSETPYLEVTYIPNCKEKLGL